MALEPVSAACRFLATSWRSPNAVRREWPDERINQVVAGIIPQRGLK